MALTAEEEELVNAVNAAMPPWFKADDRAQEELGMMAKMMGSARTIGDHWLKNQAFITRAQGATATEPDWLAQHARDRGTYRQGLESDATLAFRLRALTNAGAPHSIVIQAIRDAVQGVLDSASVVGDFATLEFPRDAAYFGQLETYSMDGGTFIGPDGSGDMEFVPDEPFPFLPMAPPEGRIKGVELIFLAVAAPGNAGTFEVTGLTAAGVKFNNPIGVAGYDATTWAETRRLDVRGVAVDDFPTAYLYDPSEGGAGTNVALADRLSPGALAGILIMLPLGTPADVADAVREAVRTRKAAGVVVTTETRLV